MMKFCEIFTHYHNLSILISVIKWTPSILSKPLKLIWSSYIISVFYQFSFYFFMIEQWSGIACAPSSILVINFQKIKIGFYILWSLFLIYNLTFPIFSKENTASGQWKPFHAIHIFNASFGSIIRSNFFFFTFLLH